MQNLPQIIVDVCSVILGSCQEVFDQCLPTIFGYYSEIVGFVGFGFIKINKVLLIKNVMFEILSVYIQMKNTHLLEGNNFHDKDFS